MLSREIVAGAYALNALGVVTQPGKFEGEPWYVVALWDMACEGLADRGDHDGDTLVSSFALDAELTTIMGFRPISADYIALWERSDGFVCHSMVSGASLDALTSDSEEV